MITLPLTYSQSDLIIESFEFDQSSNTTPPLETLSPVDLDKSYHSSLGTLPDTI